MSHTNGPTFIPGKNGGTMEDDKTYRGDIDDLMNWADEEGGPLSLFCYKGVDLNEFWNNLKMGFNE